MLFLGLSGLLPGLTHHSKWGRSLNLGLHSPAEHCNSRSVASTQGTAESLRIPPKGVGTSADHECPFQYTPETAPASAWERDWHSILYLHISFTPVRHTHLPLLAGAVTAARGNSCNAVYANELTGLNIDVNFLPLLPSAMI